MSSLILAALGVVVDRLFGEPTRWHPLVGFGQLADYAEKRFNKLHLNAKSLRLQGVVALLVVIGPFVLIAMWISQWGPLGVLFELLCIYLAIGARSLEEHAQRIYKALREEDLPLARERIGMIVSRDTSTLNETDISKATVESVLENGNDAIFSALFWFAIAGAPGVVLYRLSNTLDAMWGYKNERFLHFGWAAARLDDVLNYIPARLTALTYALLGNYQNAMHCWKTQGNKWKSPNAGPVMAAGAGALSVQLGGSAIYHGVEQYRAVLGKGHEATPHDIKRSIALIRQSTLLWLIIFVVFWGVGKLA